LDRENGAVCRFPTDRRRAERAIRELEVRNRAMLRVIPDLMFVMRRDGTYVDYHARDPKLLLVPPDQLLGKTIRDIMPPRLANVFMDALERAALGEDPVIVEYELFVGDSRFFEARLVRAENDCVLSIVRDVTEWRRTIERNRDLAGRLIASQEAERTRIARDLHDGVCQEIASLTVDISYLRQTGGHVQSRDVQEILTALERRAAGVAEAVRLLSHGLHPSVLQHVGLVPALQAHCAEIERQHQVQVRFYADGDVEPSSRVVALSLFRIAQEALGNAARHGHARKATISLSRGESELTLSVCDDGAGFDVAAVRQNGGLGLVSIEERARLVHGRVDIRSEPGFGTTVHVHVPIQIVDNAHGRKAGRHASSA
jgi:signal transduction histidine kinase